MSEVTTLLQNAPLPLPPIGKLRGNEGGNPYLSTFAKQKLMEMAKKRYPSDSLSELGDDILSVLEDIELSLNIDGYVYVCASDPSTLNMPKSSNPRDNSKRSIGHPLDLVHRMESIRRLLAQTSILMLSQPRRKLNRLDLFDKNLHELMEDFLKLCQLFDRLFEDILSLMRSLILDDFNILVRERKYLETYIRYVLQKLESEPDSVNTENLKFFLVNYPKIRIDKHDEDSKAIYECLIGCLKEAKLTLEDKRNISMSLFALEERTSDLRRQVIKNILKYCQKVFECERQLSVYGQKSLYICALGYACAIFNAIKTLDEFDEDNPVMPTVGIQLVPREKDTWFGTERANYAGKAYFSGSGRLLYFGKTYPYKSFMTTDRMAQFLMGCGYEFISRKSKFQAALCGGDEIPVSSEIRVKLFNVLL